MTTRRFAAAATLTVAVLAASRADAAPIWKGDCETGDLSQGSSKQIVSSDRTRVVGSPVRQGKYAVRVEVRQGDDPINASGNRAKLLWMSHEKEGDERWYAWSTLWPSDYPSDPAWQLFVQWHHSGNNCSPPLAFHVAGETVMLGTGKYCNAGGSVLWKTPLVRGAWHDFVFHAKWSSDPKVGFVELWYDGAHVLPKTPAATLFPGMTNYLNVGLYRKDTIQKVGVIYHDGGTRRECRARRGMDAGGRDAGGRRGHGCGSKGSVGRNRRERARGRFDRGPRGAGVGGRRCAER
jgi:hypothetical protein